MTARDRKLKLAQAKAKQRSEKMAPAKAKAAAAGEGAKATKDLLGTFKAEILGLIKAHEARTELFLEAVKALDRVDDVRALGEALSKLNAKLDKGISVNAPQVKVNVAKTELKPQFNVPSQDKAIIEVTQQIRQLTEKLQPKQDPKNFIPIRRVIRRGPKDWDFDDTSWGGAPGGGSSPASSTGKTQLTDGVDDLPIGPVTAKTGVVTASGDTVILSVASGNKVRLYHWSIVPTTSSTADLDVVLKIGTNSIQGWRTNTAGGGFAHSPKNGQGWFEGADGEDVALNLSGADNIRYNITYEVVAV